MDNFPPVTEYMATKLITFTPETDIRDAINIILKKQISGAPVLNEKKELVGMLSEVDCLKLLVNGPYDEAPSKFGQVRDFMSTEVHTISSDKTIIYAAYEFVNSGYKRLPVVENGKLIGQISRSDVLRAVQKIAPSIKVVPDSWKGRVPAVPDHKKSRHNKNS